MCELPQGLQSKISIITCRKKWLYAVEETVEDLKQLPSWRTGGTLLEKARLGQAELLQEARHLR